jgi:hypothetical protein
MSHPQQLDVAREAEQTAPLRVGSGTLLERRDRINKYKREWEQRRMQDPEYRARRREQGRKNKAKERAMYPERVAARKAANRLKHIEKEREAKRKYYVSRREEILNLKRGNRKWDAEYHRQYRQKASAQMPDWYVKVQLSKRSPLKDWPQSVIECKRAELQLKRLWQNQKTSANSATNYSTPSNG